MPKSSLDNWQALLHRHKLESRARRNSARTLNRLRMKWRAFFKLAFGSIIAYETVFVFETRPRAKADLKIVNRAKVDVRLLQGKNISDLNKLAVVVARIEPVVEHEVAYALVEERFKAGGLCFVAEKNGHIANYVWVSFETTSVDEIGRKIRVGPPFAYRYDGYTVPEYRGLGILPLVMTRIADHLFKNGIEEIYDVVVSNNMPSLRAHEKVGSRKMGKITLVKLFGSSRYVCKGSTASDCFRLKKMFSI